jgi:hypothetical protein
VFEQADRALDLRVDVEPKLRFGPQLSLMIMANSTLAFAKLPRSIPGKFVGDFNKWYPRHRQLPMFARVLTGQSGIQRKAARLLPLRFSDSPDPN